MEKVDHPALAMEDMTEFAEGHDDHALAEEPAEQAQTGTPSTGTTGETPAEVVVSTETQTDEDAELTPERLARIRQDITETLRQDLRDTITRDVVKDIIGTLSRTFLGEDLPEPADTPETTAAAEAEESAAQGPVFAVAAQGPSAAERLNALSSVAVPRDEAAQAVWTATLGATPEAGGTRGRTLTVGGHTAMPFHLWEGRMPHRPLVAMEVFDTVSEKYPEKLREIYGDLLDDPAAMARACVQRYGADLVSVRLDGTHPERGNRSPDQAVAVVKAVLDAVDVPLIVTGHSHYETCNEVMKAVAQACAGENLLLNWVEQDNYRTIAGAALAYGHTVVAQSPIDVNIAKQLNILLTNMDVKQGQIVMDPMTGAMGYGIEYTYSVMERIRQTGLGGDAMLAGPMLVTPGQECIKVKEVKAPEADFPAWGDLGERAALWELATATNLLYAGADILIMYHPDAAVATKKTIFRLMDGAAQE
jgi:acetyl-CoA decarbonylase/synthase complex subunit delta